MMKNLVLRKFIDTVKLKLCGGPGGNGLPKYNGIGGKGGSVIAIGDSKANLKDILVKYPNRRLIAGRGDDAKMFALKGSPGNNLYMQVPLGTTFHILNSNINSPNSDTGSKVSKNIGELNKEGEKLELAAGGEPGSSSNLYHGQLGEKHTICVELKLIADVGLVGFPNAGKSSLLKSMSNAKPKIANYPFTTLTPQIGVLHYKEDFREITMADLPGLIENAHNNYGLGHSFLRHIERTKLLLFLIDLKGFKLDLYSKFRNAQETIALLIKEIEMYDRSLLNKPSLLVFNKNDLIDQKESKDLQNLITLMKKDASILSNLVENGLCPKTYTQFDDVVSISTVTKSGILELKKRIRDAIDYYALKEIRDRCTI